jgi:ribosomal-protein-alanine N-acetyltransferase
MQPFESSTTEHLHLRRPVESDARAVLEYWSDPEVHRFLQHPVSDDVSEIQDFLGQLEMAWENGDSYGWGIIEAESERFIGLIEARVSPHGVELGFVLHRDMWGKGYMTETVEVVSAWALEQPEIYRVWAYVHVGNIASQRVLEKAGMVNEGRMHRWGPRVDKPPVDSFMYARWTE